MSWREETAGKQSYNFIPMAIEYVHVPIDERGLPTTSGARETVFVLTGVDVKPSDDSQTALVGFIDPYSIGAHVKLEASFAIDGDGITPESVHNTIRAALVVRANAI